MGFRQYCKSLVQSYFLALGGITVAMAVLGAALYPEARLPYTAFFSPPLYAAAAMLPSIVLYSRRELPVRQYARRQAAQVVLRIGVILGLLVAVGLRDGATLAWVGLAVLLVEAVVRTLKWLLAARETAALNDRLQRWQADAG